MQETSDSLGGDLFRLAVDLSPSGILAVDAAGVIQLANREVERLFGYTRDELLGQPVDMLVPERFRGKHPVFRAHYAAEPSERPMGAGRDLFGLRKDGTEVPVEIGLNPIQTPQQLIVLASIVDISARRRDEERLRQSQKLEAIGTLAGGIAHDFNNILLSIIGHTELAQQPAASPQQRSDLDQVLKAAERGRLLVQRILAFGRQVEVKRVPLRLERPIRELLHLLRASIPATIEIREILDPATPEVLSDEAQIHQILINLATNSAHAMPEGGFFEVQLTPFYKSEEMDGQHPDLRPGLYARLSVRDTGAGMPGAVVERVFEPYFTTKVTGLAAGLGLSVIHGIVKSHGGAVEIDSQPGEGTRVDIYLPAHEAGSVSPASEESGVRAAHGDRIMVVEDEEDLLIMLKRQLVGLGYHVTAHASSVEALEDFKTHPGDFDLLVTDNTMPRMTGLALASQVHGARPELPILLISGLAEDADPAELRRTGVKKLLAKPHTRRQLSDVIHELLS